MVVLGERIETVSLIAVTLGNKYTYHYKTRSIFIVIKTLVT